MLTIAVDVGVTGAVACLRDDGAFHAVEDLPIMTHSKTRWIDAVEFAAIVRRMKQGQECRAFVEKTQATPKIGVTTANSMGLTLGSTLAVMQMTGCSIELVYPQVWKRALGLINSAATDREKKLASLQRARQLFPSAPLERQLDNGRAEALLICHYAQRFRHGQQELVA
jgi:hypothetical protein